LNVINQAYNSYRDRYFHLLSRGARGRYPEEMDHVRQLINSVEKAWPALMPSPDRLFDVVVNTGLEVKPILDKVETQFPEGTRVGPGYKEVASLPESSLPTLTASDLLEKAPEGIGQGKAAELDEGIPWYYVGGIDLRVIGGVAVGLGLVTWLMRRR